MKLGMVLYQLWHRRLVLVLSLLIAVFAAVDSAYKVGLGTVTPRSIGMSTASTQILVDNPNTIVLDLNQGSYQLQQMSQSATLLGNIIVSPTVLQDVAERVGSPMGLIQTSAPPPRSSHRRSRAVGAQDDRPAVLQRSVPDQRPGQPDGADPRHLHRGAQPHGGQGPGQRRRRRPADYLATFGAKVPEGQRVRIEQLGRPRAGRSPAACAWR